MDLLLKITGLFFIVIGLFITLSLKKEAKNLEGPILHKSVADRWMKRSRTSTILMSIGVIFAVIGLILSI